MGDSVSRETPPVPDEASGVFPHGLDLVERYVALLAGPGRDRGLMGPREVPRLWERHVLNCAVVTDLIEWNQSVCDLGSGAGLPGIALALRRPDLRITLVEPLLRRATFLSEVVDELELDHVEVVRSRGEDLHGIREFDVVTSRAVAPLDTLLGWSLPLTRVGGHVLALKGASAAEELAAVAGILPGLGAEHPEVLLVGESLLLSPTTVLRVEAGPWRPIRWEDPRKKGATRAPRRRSGGS